MHTPCSGHTCLFYVSSIFNVFYVSSIFNFVQMSHLVAWRKHVVHANYRQHRLVFFVFASSLLPMAAIYWQTGYAWFYQIQNLVQTTVETAQLREETVRVEIAQLRVEIAQLREEMQQHHVDSLQRHVQVPQQVEPPAGHIVPHCQHGILAPLFCQHFHPTTHPSFHCRDRNNDWSCQCGQALQGISDRFFGSIDGTELDQSFAAMPWLYFCRSGARRNTTVIRFGCIRCQMCTLELYPVDSNNMPTHDERLQNHWIRWIFSSLTGNVRLMQVPQQIAAPPPVPFLAAPPLPAPPPPGGFAAAWGAPPRPAPPRGAPPNIATPTVGIQLDQLPGPDLPQLQDDTLVDGQDATLAVVDLDTLQDAVDGDNQWTVADNHITGQPYSGTAHHLTWNFLADGHNRRELAPYLLRLCSSICPNKMHGMYWFHLLISNIVF